MKILSFILLSCSISFSQEYWDYVPGVHNYVHSVFSPKSNSEIIVVAADSIPIDLNQNEVFPSFFNLLKGEGIVISRDGGNTFDEYNLLDSSIVLNIAESKQNSDTWIASCVVKNENRFAYSTDKGVNWEVKETGCSGTPKVMDLVALEDRMIGGAISTTNGYFYSFDEFENCTVSDTLIVSVRDVDYQDGVLWMASDDNTRSSILRSSNLGATWQIGNEGIDNLRIHCVDPSGIYQRWGIVHAGADKLVEGNYVGSGIYISRNNGLDWQLVGAEGTKVYDIEHHPKFPSFMAAACGEDGIYFSYDGGLTWQEDYRTGLPANADVRLVYIPDIDPVNGAYQLYAGVFNDGLYKSKSIDPQLTSVEDADLDNFNLLNVFPNPATDFMNLQFNNESPAEIEFSLINLDGSKIKVESKYFSEGQNNFRMDLPNNIPNGIYVISITGLNINIYSKVIVNRQL